MKKYLLALVLLSTVTKTIVSFATEKTKRILNSLSESKKPEDFEVLTNSIIRLMQTAIGQEQFRGTRGARATSEMESMLDVLDDFFKEIEIGTKKAQVLEDIMSTSFKTGTTISTEKPYESIKERYGLRLLKARVELTNGSVPSGKFLLDIPMKKMVKKDSFLVSEKTGEFLYQTLLKDFKEQNKSNAALDTEEGLLNALSEATTQQDLKLQKEGLERISFAQEVSSNRAEQQKLAQLADTRKNRLADYILEGIKNGISSIKQWFSKIFSSQRQRALKKEILDVVQTAQDSNKAPKIITSSEDAFNAEQNSSQDDFATDPQDDPNAEKNPTIKKEILDVVQTAQDSNKTPKIITSSEDAFNAEQNSSQDDFATDPQDDPNAEKNPITTKKDDTKKEPKDQPKIDTSLQQTPAASTLNTTNNSMNAEQKLEEQKRQQQQEEERKKAAEAKEAQAKRDAEARREARTKRL